MMDKIVLNLLCRRKKSQKGNVFKKKIYSHKVILTYCLYLFFSICLHSKKNRKIIIKIDKV